MNEIIDLDEVRGQLLNRLGFCGCGLPDHALRLIHDLLNFIVIFRNKPYKGDFQGEEWDAHCAADEAELQKIINDNPEGVKYCLFYLISDKGITNHGGVVPGWLEDYVFRDKLKSYIDYLNMDD